MNDKTQQAIDFLGKELFKNAIRRATDPAPSEPIETPGHLWRGGVETMPKASLTKPKIQEKWYQDLITLTTNTEVIDAMERLWGLVQQQVSSMRQTAEYADRNADRDREIEQAESYRIQMSKYFLNVVSLLDEITPESRELNVIENGLSEWLSLCHVLPVSNKEKMSVDVTVDSVLIFREVMSRQNLQVDAIIPFLQAKKGGLEKLFLPNTNKIDLIISCIEKMDLTDHYGATAKKSKRTL